MEIKAILFDKDGTLADFPATFNPATAAVIAHYAKNDSNLRDKLAAALDFDLATQTIGNNSVIIAGSGLDVARTIQPVLGFDDLEQFSAGLDKIYGEICRSTVVALPGIADALATLFRDGYVLGIATNDAEANAIAQMRTLDFEKYFTAILGADSGYGGDT